MHVHTDRHNIPNHPIQQKADNEPTADPAPDPFHDTDSELDIDTPIQEAWKAAFIEPLACSIHAVELATVRGRGGGVWLWPSGARDAGHSQTEEPQTTHCPGPVWLEGKLASYIAKSDDVMMMSSPGW